LVAFILSFKMAEKQKYSVRNIELNIKAEKEYLLYLAILKLNTGRELKELLAQYK